MARGLRLCWHTYGMNLQELETQILGYQTLLLEQNILVISINHLNKILRYTWASSLNSFIDLIDWSLFRSFTTTDNSVWKSYYFYTFLSLSMTTFLFPVWLESVESSSQVEICHEVEQLGLPIDTLTLFRNTYYTWDTNRHVPSFTIRLQTFFNHIHFGTKVTFLFSLSLFSLRSS